VIEDRPIMCLPVPVFYFWRKL